MQVGARILETGVWGAYYNVMINLDQIKDTEFKDQVGPTSLAIQLAIYYTMYTASVDL